MGKYTILVSGASGIVGYGILKSLKQTDCKLIGTTIYDDSPAECFADVVEKAPLTKEEGYISWLIEIIQKYHVDMIIPGIEDDMCAWNKNRKVLGETGVKLLLNRSELIDLCLDKWSFYQKLRGESEEYCIPTALTLDIEQVKYPFILKPRCGYGSRGIVKVEDRETYEIHKNKIGESLMVQEYIGSDEEEYTVSAFFDNDSKIQAHIALKRKLSKQGFTEVAQRVYLPDITDVLIKLANIFKPVGPTNFQFRRHEGGWKLLEINPRISSSTSIKTLLGYNECKMSVDYFLEGKKINQPDIKNGKIIRYIEDYVFYDSNHF